MLLVKNVVTGATVSVPNHYINHPVLGKNLVAVGEEVQAAPKKETKIKEQPAPAVESIATDSENIQKNKE